MFLLYYRDFFEQICSDVQFISPPEEVGEFLLHLLKGKIININQGAVNSIVSIDIGGGNIITATISCAAVEELGLKVGSDAYAVIKATNVMVGIDE